jgi:hypothetical protein
MTLILNGPKHMEGYENQGTMLRGDLIENRKE